VGVVALILGLVQAALFYDHFAVALTLVFGLGLGLWLRTWKAALPALAAFVVAYLLAVGTGWLHDARPLWEPLLGGMLAVLGGAIGGGIFDVLRRDVDARAPEPARIDSMGRRL
jgi:ABC-type Mn2+/Zn2+ transport system permease subunit